MCRFRTHGRAGRMGNHSLPSRHTCLPLPRGRMTHWLLLSGGISRPTDAASSSGWRFRIGFSLMIGGFEGESRLQMCAPSVIRRRPRRICCFTVPLFSRLGIYFSLFTPTRPLVNLLRNSGINNGTTKSAPRCLSQSYGTCRNGETPWCSAVTLKDFTSPSNALPMIFVSGLRDAP